MTPTRVLAALLAGLAITAVQAQEYGTNPMPQDIASLSSSDYTVIERFADTFRGNGSMNPGLYRVCDRYTLMLNPAAQRQEFPDQHYTIPADDPLFDELVELAAKTRHAYCNVDYSAVAEQALAAFLSDPAFNRRYLPAMRRISRHKPEPGDQNRAYQGFDRALENYLRAERQPLLDRYFAQVQELHDRYFACEGCQ
ncbi:MAG: hypothetical protein MI794_15730 [Pseudomonadales bacterium]|nr:hypothetical protein [Pseudomonadales bacterium]